jgi:RNA polymerase subunit RPABC4/transcription elongation factor Spt4
MTENW